MSIRSVTVLFVAAFFFTTVGCAPTTTDDADIVTTDGVNDGAVTPAVDADANAEARAVNKDDDLNVVVEKDVE